MRTFVRRMGIAIAMLLFFGVAAFAAEPVTLTVEVFDRAAPGYAADNNFTTRWIQQQVKKELNIDVKFVIVPRGQEVDKLNLLMAAGQAPDISYTYNEAVISNYVKNGGITDLTKLLPQYAPNLQKYLGQELLDFGVWNGKQWAIPAKRVFTGAFSGFIRKDWLDALNLKVPTTIQEFYNVLKAFKEKDPGKTGGKVIPFGLALDPNNIHWTSSLIWEAFRKKVPQEESVVRERWTLPGHKEAVQFLNKLYNEGLLSPNFVLDKDGAQYNKDIVQGNVGAFIHNFDFPYRASPGIATELKKNVPSANLVPFDAFYNVEYKSNLKFKYNPNGLFIVIPRSSKNAEAALRYLNWMAKPEVLFFLQNGNKGDQYLNVRNGVPVDFVSNDKLPDEKKYNSTGDLSFISNGREFFNEDTNLEALSFGYPGFEAEVKKAMAISLKDAYVAFRFDRILDNEAKLRQTLNTKGAELFVKAVTAKPQEFSALYDSLVRDYMASGGTRIEEEKRAAYRAMMAEIEAEKKR